MACFSRCLPLTARSIVQVHCTTFTMSALSVVPANELLTTVKIKIKNKQLGRIHTASLNLLISYSIHFNFSFICVFHNHTGLKILLGTTKPGFQNYTQNIVYREVFRNIAGMEGADDPLMIYD